MIRLQSMVFQVARAWMAAILLLGVLSGTAQAASSEPSATCHSMTPNPINDICWRCVLPLTIGSVEIANIGGMRDMPSNPGIPICMCPGWPPRVGVTIGFWEPIYVSEVIRKPYCFPSFGGMEMGESIRRAPQHGRRTRKGGEAPDAFYQVHMYVMPIFYLLGVMSDHPCLVQVPWDIAYMTEIDPSWDDTALSQTINPESQLFSNPIAQAACAVDCLSASTNLPRRELFWCAGCQGAMYPNNGWTVHHTGLVDTSLLMSQRLMYKMHRQFIAWKFHGADSLCGPNPEVIMDKRAYRPQMMAPRAVTGSVTGSCCPPMGATSAGWRAGREFPIKGEDALYMIFRKRNCCLTYY